MSTSRARRKGWIPNGQGYIQEPPPPYGSGAKVPVKPTGHWSWTDTRVTGDSPHDWKTRIALTQSATSTLVATKTLMRPMIATYRRNTDWNLFPYASRFTVTGNTHVVPARTDFSPAALNEATANAMANFAKSVRLKTRSWQGGVFAGELVETARMLKSPMRGVYDHSKKLVDELTKSFQKFQKKYDHLPTSVANHAWKASKEAADVAANGWREYNLGITPLINDINDATTAFNAVRRREAYDSLRFKGTGKARVVDFYNGPGNVWGLADGYNCKTRADKRATVVVTGAMQNANPAGEMPFAQRFGFDLSNLAPAAWELIPMSFVFDYFVTMNDIIEAWSLRFMDIGWVQVTTIEEVECKLSDFVIAENGNPLNYMLNIMRPGRSLHRYVSRRPSSVDELASPFMFKLPGYPKQTANLAALSKTWFNLMNGTVPRNWRN